jgi:tetratricopeptide (TPR) repeat protein
MASGIVEIQEAIRRNADDLREELTSLESWEAEMEAKEAAKKSKEFIEPDLPPVRGTAAPSAPKKPKEDPIATAKEQGNEYFRQCKFEDAARCYTKGIAVDPTNSAMHVMYSNRAMCYIKLQLWDLAESDATTCVQMNRTFVKGFYRRALARKAMGKLKDARTDLETALVLAPGDKDTEAELKAVSTMLQAQAKAQETSTKQAAGTQRKKLVIEEVDDEEDREAASKEQAEREKRHLRDQQEAREAEQKRAEQRRQAAEAEEQRLRNARRTNSRVEEIEDEPVPPKPAPKRQHADPLPRKIVVDLTKDMLVAPRTFIEFEQQYADVKSKAPLLLEHYFSLIPASRWGSIFGSSMTPEILSDVFKTASQATPEVARPILQGVASLPRLQELIMFMDDGDKVTGKSCVARAAVGAPEGEKGPLAALAALF